MTQERGKKFKVGDLVAFVEDWGHCFGVIEEVCLDYLVQRLHPQAPMTLWYVEDSLERAIWTFTGPVVPAWRWDVASEEWIAFKLEEIYAGTGELRERRAWHWKIVVEKRRAATTR